MAESKKATKAAKNRTMEEQHELAEAGESVQETMAGPLQPEVIQDRADAQAKVDKEKHELSVEQGKKKAKRMGEEVTVEPAEAVATPPEPTGPSPVTQPVVTAYWVAKIKSYIRDQVWQKVGKAQHDEIVDALVADLKK